LPSINDETILKTTHINVDNLSNLNWKEHSVKPLSNSGLKPNKLSINAPSSIQSSFTRNKLNNSIQLAQEHETENISSPNVHLSLDLVHPQDESRNNHSINHLSNLNLNNSALKHK